MRITKKQSILLHNEAVEIRKRVRDLELVFEKVFSENGANTSASPSLQMIVKENVKEIYKAIDSQQAIVSYLLNGVPVNTTLKQKERPERDSALVDELELSEASIRLLKRHDIFSINTLSSFLQNQSLSDLKGCGPVKAEQIEEALERYLENKTNKKEGNNNGK